MDRSVPFSFQTLTHFTLSKCPLYPEFAPWVLLLSLQPPLELLEPQTNWDELHKLRRKAQCSQGNSAPSLGKQSRLQRAKLGRDPGRNGEKSNNSLAIHLMETYPTNRTLRNETLYFFLSRAMSTANFSRLHRERRRQTVPASAPYRTTACNPALRWDRDTAHTIFIPQTDSFTPWGCSLWDTPYSSRGEFITKDHAHGKQLVRSVLTVILPSSFRLKKKQCPHLKWKLPKSLIYLG